MASIGEYPLPWAHLWPGHGRVPMLPLTSFGNKFENALFLSSLMPRANLTTTDLNEAVCSNQNLQQNNQSEDLFFSNIMKKMAQKYQDQPEEGRFPTRSFDPFLMSTDLCRIPSPISTSSLSDHDGGAGNSSQPLDLSPSASPGLDVNDDITKWSVEEVAQFVVSIDSCQSYAQVFRDHSIDGSILTLLGESHLTHTLGLKLGPAIQLLQQIKKILNYASI
ncbi:hypothetical protein TCAL_05896 [Tigriopus californicus]|uniref:SAM domain-containing protein n=1 Tax=Tigriopus californicus TaxID=6832 RepID=A0A553PP33_TIGCA|nr:sex comb on midleg-like protein 1 isoform X2 [Tigriopus californicus]TRY79436.1 hypothetical protein TCAL_05896 [Tigriopus californicus]|eukprot:TCALIF_05896-PA protein Name:"Similar to SAMD7 Sterile alpha motif domain-containing protein 7 (Homo sapiens)" AED:0.00 eAED:0.00 QI:63/1/0.75/1/1/1/4/167/220